MQTETNNKPLYKRLNEERAAGEWVINSTLDAENLLIMNNELAPILRFCFSKTGLQELASANYTALAVNSLSKIADILENIAKMDNKDFANSFHTKAETAKQIMLLGKLAKEALSLIS